MQKTILVVGGAGYIGSHMVYFLHKAGYKVIVFDNLQTGNDYAVASHQVIIGDLADKTKLHNLFLHNEIYAVIHFAALIEVAESVQNPLKYYKNNVLGSINLIEAMIENGISNLIFSSTAAVYGEPSAEKISEDHPCLPINPYGRTKLIIENFIRDMAASNHLKFFIFRYFNAAGAHYPAGLGENHPNESHLIPLILQVAAGQRETITIYGNDYATPDGTCVRDFIHVSDVCGAHLLALNEFDGEIKNKIYNIGTGIGCSVMDVIETARRITQHAIPITYAAKRSGDPSILVADSTFIKSELGWQATHSRLENILEDAWNFIQSSATVS